MVFLGDQVGMLPFVEGTQSVGSHHQLEFPSGMLLFQIGQGINGVGWRRELEFDIGCPESVIIFNGQPYHLQAVVILQE